MKLNFVCYCCMKSHENNISYYGLVTGRQCIKSRISSFLLLFLMGDNEVLLSILNGTLCPSCDRVDLMWPLILIGRCSVQWNISALRKGHCQLVGFVDCKHLLINRHQVSFLPLQYISLIVWSSSSCQRMTLIVAVVLLRAKQRLQVVSFGESVCHFSLS